MRRVIGGLVVAAAAAWLLATPAILGIETWKWALAALGAALYVATSRRRR
ncbi:MAG TPA: hypothetical protein VNI78_00765 [Vicinamibacterales bacterium]|nr:hypothetical protein [Vicinamibacterales bacterium]